MKVLLASTQLLSSRLEDQNPTHHELDWKEEFYVAKLLSNFYLFIYFKLFYCCSITVVCVFSPPLPSPHPNPPPSLASTLSLGFVHVTFIVVSENPSPHCPLPAPLWLLLDCS